MSILLLFACVSEDEVPEADSEEPAEVATTVIEVSPVSLDFGVVSLGSTVVQTLWVENHGGTTVTFTAVDVDTDALALEAQLGSVLTPGGATEVLLSWTPQSPANLGATLDLLLTGGSTGLTELLVPITGSASGPLLSATLSSADFGTVNVGCEGTTTLTLANVGTATLTIDSVTLAAGSDLTLDAADGDLPALPWALAPAESIDVEVTFAPMASGNLAEAMVIGSDDPVNPDVQVEISGRGYIENEETDTYEVEPVQNVTAIFAVNEVVNSTFDARFDAALPVFFDTLQASRAPYRVAFAWPTTGEVDSDIAYIDETISTGDAVDIVADMIAGASGDNDYLLQTLGSAIEVNRDWLLDDGDEWEESKLNLVGMNSDQEQSSGNYVIWVNEYLTYKDDAANIAVHAIGGDVSVSACAEPFTPFEDAAAATGGAFLDICASNWDAHMETLAYAMLGGTQTFALTGEPATWSIEVWVDGVELTDGWTYNSDLGIITFDEDSYPDEGAEVQITYITATECPDAT